MSIDAVTAGYNGRDVLREMSLSVPLGEFAAIAGPNGAGKSTLLKVLAGLLRPTSGLVKLNDRPIGSYRPRQLARSVAVILQGFACPYEFTVQDIVAIGRNPFLRRWRPLSGQDWQAIEEAMEMTEVDSLRNRLFLQLSDGEKQRVILARAFTQQPSILLLDEPSAHLDIHHQVHIFNILRRMNHEKAATILCVTHDLTLAAQYVDRLIFMRNGNLLAQGHPSKVLCKEIIERLFHTQVFIGTVPGTLHSYIFPLTDNI